MTTNRAFIVHGGPAPGGVEVALYALGSAVFISVDAQANLKELDALTTNERQSTLVEGSIVQGLLWSL